jgi:predicted lipoprotein with Yx(FWY)xxD motif
MFSAADVPGLGMVVVDGRGRTVYLLMSGDHKNVACNDTSGCTKVWPDLPLPEGTSPATAASGLQASLLSTMKLGDGETYPTYNGWLMYEYVGDSGPGQAHGQSIQSFGGTWYALSPAGMPVMAAAAPAASSSTSGGNGY